MISRSLLQFLDGLTDGDPAALGLLGLIGVMALIGVTIWFVDQRAKKEELNKKGRRPSR